MHVVLQRPLIRSIAGSGAVMRATAGSFDLLQVEEAYTLVEWLEIDANNQSPTRGVLVNNDGDNVLLQNLIIHLLIMKILI